MNVLGLVPKLLVVVQVTCPTQASAPENEIRNAKQTMELNDVRFPLEHVNEHKRRYSEDTDELQTQPLMPQGLK